MPIALPFRTRWLFLSALTYTILTSPALAQNKITPQGLTDEQVLDAIHNGAKYLLGAKKGDNYEAGTGGPQNLGGETCLVLYALLHVGESLGEEDEYQSKLKFNSQELTPVVKYVIKVDAIGTYTAGLQASALALVNPKTELGKDAALALTGTKKYLTEAMGADGGYAYTGAKAAVAGKIVDFDAVWAEYIEAKNRGDAKTTATAKLQLENMCGNLAHSFVGVTGRLQVLAADIKTRGAEARQKKDQAGAARADAEMRELEAIGPALMKKGSGLDYAKPLAVARKHLDDAARAMQTGGTKDVKDANGKVKKVPKTPDELKKDLEDAKAALAQAETSSKDHFQPPAGCDLSNSQYGTLGAWALADLNVELPTAYWTVSDRFWRLSQNKDGGWGYKPEGGGTKLSMSVAGLASLYITSDQVDTGAPRLEPRPDHEIDRGLEWLHANFTVRTSLYALYGVERAGLASGLKSFGKTNTNWFTEGAAHLLSAQKPDGSWGGEFSTNVSTAYALLFLARGRNAVVFNKLQYEGPWNARPRDNANITAWMSKKFERPINWQIVGFNIPLEEWQDAPVLLITGSKALNFSPQQIERLKAYVEAGGMIFSTADGDKTEFTESVRKIAGQLVQENGQSKYEMRELKKDHMLFSQELWAQIDNPPKIFAMSNGVREIWVHSTVDMGASWQAHRVASRENFEFPANLNRYASGKASLRSKLQPLSIAASNAATTRSVALARIDYAGNANPEPGAWPRMAKYMRTQAQTDLQLQTVKFTQLNAKTTPVAHLTGTTQIPVTPEDVAAIKKYLADGGMLFIDAAGGNQQFIQSAMNLIQQVYPDTALGAISTNSRLHNGTIPGSVNTANVAFRRFFRLKVGNANAPQLQGVSVKDRYTIIFSGEDITSGLLGTNTWGILGYTPESSMALARNILLYALSPNPPAATATAPATSTAPATATAPAPK